MIKRIFSDMDGTLLNSKGKLAASNARSIKEAGISLTLVSARAPMEMLEAICTLELTGPQVAFNGGLIYQMEKGHIKPLYAQAIKKDTVKELLLYLSTDFPQVSLSYYDLKHWYCDTIDQGIRYEKKLTGCQPTKLSRERFLAPQTAIFKLMLITFDEATMQALLSYLAKLDRSDITYQRSGKAYLEITHHLAKKSQGIGRIMREEQLKKRDTAAFGDGHNDLPMFEQVGYAIAMDNAMEAIKDYAHYITQSNDQDGVSYGIKQFLQKESL